MATNDTSSNLAGGTDASNIDPYAKEPTAGNHWIKTGPHVMIVGAESHFYDMYPKSAQPDTTVPYIRCIGIYTNAEL